MSLTLDEFFLMVSTKNEIETGSLMLVEPSDVRYDYYKGLMQASFRRRAIMDGIEKELSQEQVQENVENGYQAIEEFLPRTLDMLRYLVREGIAENNTASQEPRSKTAKKRKATPTSMESTQQSDKTIPAKKSKKNTDKSSPAKKTKKSEDSAVTVHAEKSKKSIGKNSAKKKTKKSEDSGVTVQAEKSKKRIDKSSTAKKTRKAEDSGVTVQAENNKKSISKSSVAKKTNKSKKRSTK
ncbi:unnamed protein product [Caenorhabditis sp. 36 PRJEB53466]|nr:unnamed protein product [Caenorhabditis sp. 36 PRJEB53466]